jgi:hypothetical protein
VALRDAELPSSGRGDGRRRNGRRLEFGPGLGLGSVIKTGIIIPTWEAQPQRHARDVDDLLHRDIGVATGSTVAWPVDNVTVDRDPKGGGEPVSAGDRASVRQ